MSNTKFSGAADKNSDFAGNTILLECQRNGDEYIPGLEILKFKFDDKILDYMSIMGNNMLPFTFAIG